MTEAQIATRVLLVDDDEDSRDLLALYLRGRGLDVATAASCAHADGALEGWTPDAAILDLTLPDGDGIELGRNLRSRLERLRLVALSGHSDDEHRDRSNAAGFDAYLVKPADPDAIYSALTAQLSAIPA